jgi:hypothetical protein
MSGRWKLNLLSACLSAIVAGILGTSTGLPPWLVILFSLSAAVIGLLIRESATVMNTFEAVIIASRDLYRKKMKPEEYVVPYITDYELFPSRDHSLGSAEFIEIILIFKNVTPWPVFIEGLRGKVFIGKCFPPDILPPVEVGIIYPLQQTKPIQLAITLGKEAAMQIYSIRMIGKGKINIQLELHYLINNKPVVSVCCCEIKYVSGSGSLSMFVPEGVN